VSEPDEHGPVVRDRRRIDPVTGQPRQPVTPAGAGGPGGHGTAGLGEDDLVAEAAEAAVVGAQIAALEAELAERTADAQRLQAEYTNYRRRVDRDRDLVREQAVAGVLGELLAVLDDVGRAREHDELSGAFRSVGEALEAAVARVGLVVFGAVGEPFDPTIHEALTHTLDESLEQATCVAVYQPGYTYAGRVLRPARVGVGEPTTPTVAPPEG